MADFNDALSQFLRLFASQGATGPASGGGDLPSGGVLAQGSTGIGAAPIAQQRQAMPSPTPQGGPIGEYRGEMPMLHAKQLQPLPLSGVQSQGAGQTADGAQMPAGVMESILKRLFGLPAQGQQLDKRGGLGQILPNYAQQPMN